MPFSPKWWVGVLGALIAQPLFFILAFLWGAVFGASSMMASAPHPTNGLAGGREAVANAFFVYVISFGIVAFLFSVAGAVLAVLLAFVVHWLRQWQGSRVQSNSAP
jgi:hypothetical protein